MMLIIRALFTVWLRCSSSFGLLCFDLMLQLLPWDAKRQVYSNDRNAMDKED
jgi:hypothetical protein